MKEDITIWNLLIYKTILFPYIQDHLKFTYIQDHLKFTYIQDHFKFTYIHDHFKFTYIHDHFKFTYIQDHLKFTYIQDHLKFTYIQNYFLVVPLGTSLASYLACCGYFRFRHSRNIYCLFTSGLDILETSIVYPLDGVIHIKWWRHVM